MRVCILGFNLSSLTLAKAITNQNIYVDIFNSSKSHSLDKSRTIGISKTNIDFFNKNIINIKDLLWEINKIEIYTDNLKNELLLKFGNDKDHLFSIVKNHKLFNILENSLSRNKFVKKINKIDFLNLQKNYDLIINTEYNNFITKKYFNKKILKKYNSFAYTTIIEHEEIINNVASQIFTKRGPLAFLPISNTKTSIVYSFNKLDKRDKTQNIQDLIQHYNFKYKIKKIRNIKSFELNSVSLRKYYYKNILAFGDLLHKIHPLAGQGFNMTIRDIKILTNIINNKNDLGLPIDSLVNIEFEKKSKHKNFIFMNGIDFIHEFFNFESKIKNDILSKSVKIIGKNSSINKIITKIADKGIII